ncbi:DNA polymerase III subunit gamma/tau [Pelagibacterales bacterium SAG-MED48]|nr:DNA polymerase III subunit gamma/tau [Pelagibacterales bacterium SAG-MED48]
MNNNSKVLALKYRPQSFDDLIGQEVVVETITNSIKANKVPNAYLFTGIRGIGKTTTARIVAKALNCSNGIENLCKENLCENCEAITNSSHIDVLEMDAASKTGVDDVRDLIEFSRYGPTSAKYKIFIIDEVHMLSKQAFNALLKTLEEPPEYLKFIFATTEIKKIPITVVSRCQGFDLSRIKSTELFELFSNLLDKLKLDYVTILMNLKVVTEQRQEKEEIKQSLVEQIKSGKKIGRNEPCSCGSGKKFKHCCGAL